MHNPDEDSIMQLALERGLLPDDETLKQLTEERGSLVSNVPVALLQWPAEPLRTILISETSLSSPTNPKTSLLLWKLMAIARIGYADTSCCILIIKMHCHEI